MSPRVAQSLARHSTITLTMDRYSHVNLLNERTAIECLPDMVVSEQVEVLKTGTDYNSVSYKKTDTKTDSKTAQTAYFAIHSMSASCNIKENFNKIKKVISCLKIRELCTLSHLVSVPFRGKKLKAAPGFEPGNIGFANRR